MKVDTNQTPTNQANQELIKTPLSEFIIDEDSVSFDKPELTRAPSKFRERPRHQSQGDFNEFIKKRQDDDKESEFDAQINFILSSFAKQYMREYIKMKIKTSVYDTIDKELNRKSFTGVPSYYHLKKKNIKQSQKKQHPLPHNNMSEEIRATQGFQPVYSLRFVCLFAGVFCEYAKQNHCIPQQNCIITNRDRSRQKRIYIVYHCRV